MDNLYISQAMMNSSSTTMNVSMDIKGEPVVEQYKQVRYQDLIYANFMLNVLGTYL